MSDLFIKLIEKIVDLLKYRQDADRKLFDDFIAPLLADVDKLHHEVVQGFALYEQDLIKSGDTYLGPEHSVLLDMKSDGIARSAMRTRLLVAQEGLAQMKAKEVAEFAEAMFAYLNYACVSLNRHTLGRDNYPAKEMHYPAVLEMSNPAYNVYQGLIEIAAMRRGLHSSEAIHEINLATRNLTVLYRNVQSSGLKAKKALLHRQ